MTDITELTSVQKNANIHRLSRLIAYASNDELRQAAVEVEHYTDQLIEALEKAQQHIARQEQILLNQDESLSIRRGDLEAAQQERDNWLTSFENERFRADKLKAHIDEMTEERTASINELSRIIQREIKAKREAEKRIAVLEESNAQVIQSRDHYKRMTEEGLKRLAKSRTVKLPELCVGVVQGGHAVMVPYAAGHWFNKTAILEMLAAAGIKWEAE